MRLLPVLLAAVVAAPALAHAAPAPSVLDRNLAWILHGLGLDAAPSGDVDVATGDGVRRMPAADAFRLAAARFGELDVAAVAASAAEGARGGVGDAWVVEFMGGGCRHEFARVEADAPALRAHEQLESPGGDVRVLHGAGSGFWAGEGLIVDLTTKGATGGHYRGQASVFGQADVLCFSFFGLTYFEARVAGAVCVSPPTSAPAPLLSPGAYWTSWCRRTLSEAA